MFATTKLATHPMPATPRRRPITPRRRRSGALFIALTFGSFGCAALFGANSAAERREDNSEAEEHATATVPAEAEPSDHAHAHEHADSGANLIERVPGDTFTIVNTSRNSVEFAMLPLLLGAERDVLEVGERIEGKLRPGEEFTFDRAFAVADGFYTIDFALRVAGVDLDGARVQEESQVEWRVRVADRRATTANNNEWLVAIMHDQKTTR
jgi:hypothetical protein